MTIFLQFALVGLGAGAAYALLALGLVLIQRGSGVVNFAHGSMAMLGAFVFYTLRTNAGIGFVPAGIVAMVAVAAFGALVYLIVMRQLIKGSALARIIATLGLLVIVQAACTLIWGQLPRTVQPFLPDRLLEFAGVAIGVDRLILVAIAITASLVVWIVVRSTTIGTALRANAENRVAASTLGWSPTMLGMLTWGLGGALAALAGILISPLTGIAVDQMPLLVIPALAAAIVGRFTSFPLTLVAALLIGVGQSLASRYIETAGIVEALPFLTILVVLVIMRPQVEGRTQVAELLPRLGSGRVNPLVVAVSFLVAAGMMLVLPTELIYAVMVSLTWAIVMLSVVVLLGYAGQLSLAQFALAGIAALIAGRVVAELQVPFLVGLVAGVALTIPVGLVVALPALRTKGASLAVVTLGMAVTVSAMVFNNADWTGGTDGTPVGYPEIFGLAVDATLYPERYAIVVLTFFTACCLLVTNIRRGGSGRRLLAVRTNERAASALGVNVFAAKMYAFAVGAGLAAVGGILLGFRNPFVLYTEFVPLNSILVVAYVVVGGVGYVMGAFNGGTLVVAGIGTWIMHEIVPGAQPVWLSLVGGIAVTLLVVVNPNGLTDDQIHLLAKLRSRLRPRKPVVTVVPTWTGDRSPVRPQTLTVEGLTIRFGGVTALSEASLVLHPGEIMGLIGPNGAGKTTFIDGVTGFVKPAGGRVLLGDQDITRSPVHQRSRAGVSRSFQSLELFESSSVSENLRVAADPTGAMAYLRDLVFPLQAPLSPPAVAALELLGLVDDLDTEVADLSYGRRRLVAIARAIAAEPSVLLLDEPAAGLSADETAALGEVVVCLAKEWGMSVLVIEHDMDFVMKVCDRITVLDFGRQIGGGTPAEVRRDPAVVAAYLGAPAEDVVPAGAVPHPVPVPSTTGGLT